MKQETLAVHDDLCNHSHHEFGQGHEHQEHNSSKDTPGRTEDEVARSSANGARESKETSVDLPKQIACEAKLEGTVVSLDTRSM